MIGFKIIATAIILTMAVTAYTKGKTWISQFPQDRKGVATFVTLFITLCSAAIFFLWKI